MINGWSRLRAVLSLGLLAGVLLAGSTQSFAADKLSPEEQDPLESWNRAVFVFNDKADKYVLKPVAKRYKKITPKLVNEGITNFFQNLDDVKTLVNSLLQGKVHNAVVALNRVVYNSSFGLFGFIDVATGFGLRADVEDFGQTLGVWGWQSSTYLMLPLLGPSTVRDFSGRVVDRFTDPILYLDHELHRDEKIAVVAVDVIDKRADILGADNLMINEDRYSFIRSAFYQNREFKIHDGVIDDPFADEDFEDFEDF